MSGGRPEREERNDPIRSDPIEPYFILGVFRAGAKTILPRLSERSQPTRPGVGERSLESREPADQKEVAAPLNGAMNDRIQPNGQQQHILGGAEEEVPKLRKAASEPSRLHRVSKHSQADEEGEAPPGEAGIAGECPDDSNGGEIRERLEEKNGERHPKPDLVPARMTVQEPSNAALTVHILDDVMAEPDGVAFSTHERTDHLIFGQEVANRAETTDFLENARGHQHRLPDDAGNAQGGGKGHPRGDESV